jgi:2',3'-cyclic-nucleotide 2'-phosphodiesterase/3'-nucleotidase
MKNAEDHLLNFKRDEDGAVLLVNGNPQFAGSYYNFSSAAGIFYTVDISKAEGNKISIESLSDGKTFDLNKTYTVALNSYRGNGGGGHLTIGAKIPADEVSTRVINSTQKDFRYYLMKWIEKEKIVNPQAIGNWNVIPKDWWEKGKEKDIKILFKKH